NSVEEGDRLSLAADGLAPESERPRPPQFDGPLSESVERLDFWKAWCRYWRGLDRYLYKALCTARNERDVWKERCRSLELENDEYRRKAEVLEEEIEELMIEHFGRRAVEESRREA